MIEQPNNVKQMSSKFQIKVIYLIVALLAGCSDKRRFEYYDTGQVKNILPAGGQLLDGVVEEFLPDGRIFAEKKYKKNVLVTTKVCPQDEELQMIYNNLENLGWIETPCGPNSPLGKKLCNSQLPFACRYIVSPYEALLQMLRWPLIYIILPLAALYYLIVGYSRLRVWWRQ